MAEGITKGAEQLAVEVYVSDKEGNDQDGDGSEQKPFKTSLKVVNACLSSRYLSTIASRVPNPPQCICFARVSLAGMPSQFFDLRACLRATFKTRPGSWLRQTPPAG